MGQVYVYESVATNEFVMQPVLKRKYVQGARFGAGLTNLGDLDGDGNQDFAVGAPFEEDGVVYIYRGNSNREFGTNHNKLRN